MIRERMEYADETLLNVRLMLRSLYSIILDRQIVSDEDLARALALVEEQEKNCHAKKAMMLNLACDKCGRVSSVRLDRTVKCLYCGTTFHPQSINTNEPVSNAASLEDMFYCEVLQSDIDMGSVGTVIDFSKNPAWNAVERQIAEQRRYLSVQSPILGVGVAALDAVLFSSSNGAIPMNPLRDYLANQNRLSERICNGMKALWKIAASNSPDDGASIMDIYNKISEKKKELACEKSVSTVKCPHCGTVNIRSELFALRCSSCEKTITLELSPCLSVFYEKDSEDPESVVLLKRAKEYMYSLYEAVYEYVREKFNITWADISEKIVAMIEQDTSEEKKPRVCSHCNRTIPESSKIGNKCLYCGKANGADAVERFL